MQTKMQWKILKSNQNNKEKENYKWKKIEIML